MVNEEILTSMVAKGLVEEVSKKLNNSLELQEKIIRRESRTGEIKQTDLISDFGISPSTLKTWEAQGLQRIQRGKLVFYLLSDLHKFTY